MNLTTNERQLFADAGLTPAGAATFQGKPAIIVRPSAEWMRCTKSVAGFTLSKCGDDILATRNN